MERLWEFFLGLVDLQSKLFRVRVSILMSFFTVSLAIKILSKNKFSSKINFSPKKILIRPESDKIFGFFHDFKVESKITVQYGIFCFISTNWQIRCSSRQCVTSTLRFLKVLDGCLIKRKYMFFDNARPFCYFD
jgi:hypothetical protein